MYIHKRRKTTVKDQEIRLRKEGGEITGNGPEVCEELSSRFREAFTVETERLPANRGGGGCTSKCWIHCTQPRR